MSIKNSVRYLTFLALKEIILENKFSNEIIDQYLTKNFLNSNDRRLFTNLVYGVTFYNLRLDYELSSFLKVNKTDPMTLLILKMTIFQMFYLERIPDYAAINEAIEIVKIVRKRDVKFVTAVLHQARRQGLRSLSKIKDPIKQIAMTYSMPTWIVSKLNEEVGTKKTNSILKSLLTKPRSSLRINTTKITRNQFLNKFPKDFEPSQISADGVISRKGNVMHLSGFKEGLYTVQDESSQLVTQNLCIKEGDVILDACAAPGGKTTHIAQNLSEKAGGIVHAFDLSEKKINRIKENATRMGLNSVIKTHCANVTDLNQVLPNIKFDKILVDAPCSGFGLLRRKPEVKYNHEISDIMNLQSTQMKILSSVTPYLKNGGLLMYSTCTIFKEETSKVVFELLKEQSDFNLVVLKKNPKINNESMLQLYPDDFLTDGFFMALMQKQEA